jgi:hypothetical protein
LEDVGSLSAKEVLGHSTAECRTQSFILWPLHEDEQDDQNRDDDFDDQ